MATTSSSEARSFLTASTPRARFSISSPVRPSSVLCTAPEVNVPRIVRSRLFDNVCCCEPSPTSSNRLIFNGSISRNDASSGVENSRLQIPSRRFFHAARRTSHAVSGPTARSRGPRSEDRLLSSQAGGQ